MAFGEGAFHFADPGRVTTVRNTVRRVLAEYQAAYFALNGLSGKVEDMRILSLNAELAAGRAGLRGAAIKVATQSTRELVGQLSQAATRMNVARYRCYRSGALAMRGLPRIGRFGRTADLVRSAGGAHADSGLAALDAAIRHRAVEAIDELSGLTKGGQELEKLANGLKGLVMQALAIANNLAIEATGVVGHETVFALVARDMQAHIAALKGMIEDASSHVAQGNRAAVDISTYIELMSRQVR